LRRSEPASTVSSAATRHELLDERDVLVETAVWTPPWDDQARRMIGFRAEGRRSAHEVFGDRRRRRHLKTCGAR
jgi:hypothetical protein